MQKKFLKRCISFMLTVIMISASLSGLVLAGEDLAGKLTREAWYLVSNDGSGKELVVDENHNGGMLAGNGAIAWVREENPDHWWQFVDNGDGTYQIRNMKSELYLAPRTAQAGSILEQQEAVDGDLTQSWIAEVVEGLDNTIRIRNAGTGYYIEKNTEASMTGGWRVDIVQTELDEAEVRQMWTLESAGVKLSGELYVSTSINRGTVTPSSVWVDAGESQEFVIKPDAGHQIVSIEVNGTAAEFEAGADGRAVILLEDIREDMQIEVTTVLQDWVVCAPSNDFPGRNMCLSPRVVEGLDGTLYCTFEWGERSEITGEYCFPVYESKDKGQTWDKVGEVTNDDEVHPDEMLPDTDHGGVMKNYQWQLQNCPQLFVLPEDLGDLAAGTLLCAGNAVTIEENAPRVSDAGDGGLWKTSLDMYYSTDGGRNWTYLSTLAEAGRNIMGYDPVWEPFFVYYEGELICYYSDERVYNYNNNQKLVHTTTTDGVNWTDLVDDVMIPGNNRRPGMPIVTQMENGNWIYVYEGVGISSPFVSFFKISDSPLDWGDPTDVGEVLWASGSPYITTLKDGRLVANTSATSEVIINTEKDASGQWIPYKTGANASYNRCLLQLSTGELLITGSSQGFGRVDNYIYIKLVDVENDLQDTIKQAQYVTNKQSNKVLGIWQGSSADGAKVVTWSNTGDTNQMWMPEKQADGTYLFVNYSTDKVLAAADEDIDSVLIQTSRAEAGSDGQRLQSWTMEAAGDGYWYVKNAASDLYLSLNNNQNPQAEVDQYVVVQSALKESDAQKWRFEKVTSNGEEFIPDTGDEEGNGNYVLDFYIRMAKNIDTSNMLRAAREELEAAILYAEGVEADAETGEIVKAVVRLVKAIAKSEWFYGDSDLLAELAELAEAALAESEDNAAAQAVRDALEKASEILEDPTNYFDYEIQEAYDELLAAYEALTKLDWSNLLSLLAVADILMPDVDGGAIVKGVDAFRAVYAAATGLTVSSDDVTQDDIDAAADALMYAMAELRYAANKEYLAAKVTQARALMAADLSIYTEESVRALKEVTDYAVILLEDTAISEDEQEDVTAAAEAVERAIKGLQKKASAEQEKPGGTDKEETTDTTDADKEKKAEVTTAKTAVSRGSSVAKTGDHTTAMAWLLIIVLAAAVCILTRKRVFR